MPELMVLSQAAVFSLMCLFVTCMWFFHALMKKALGAAYIQNPTINSTVLAEFPPS